MDIQPQRPDSFPKLAGQGIRPLDGPVVADLAEVSTAGVAQLDARWAAAVLAGGARDAGELRGWLEMVGLLPAPPHWMTRGSA